ncbi:RNA-guided endonuclease TnpB family protein, partial [Streptomyces sp. NPDC058572]
MINQQDAKINSGRRRTTKPVTKVRDAYTTLKANIRAGNLGKSGSKRRMKAGTKPTTFRPKAAQPYDDRCLSRRYDA